MKLVYAGPLLSAALLLSACAPHAGRYAPDCTAFAGSVVSLDGSSFVWERFTDEVRVDADGNRVEPYPDYPKRGTYRKEGNALYLEDGNGDAVATLYLHKDSESYRLLTVEEHEAWERSGEYARCALTRGVESS